MSSEETRISGNRQNVQSPEATTPTSPSRPYPSKTYELETEWGKIKVHVQGQLAEKEKKAVFLTVHDIGCNHSNFKDFIEHPCMSEFKQRSIFIHVDLPGQAEGDPDLPDSVVFPNIKEMGEQLIPTVLDYFKVNLIVGIGEGAGANVLVRFALAHTSRTLGLVLIHLVSADVGMLGKLKEHFLSGKRRPSEAFQMPENVIALHKFGQNIISGITSSNANEERLVTDYKARVANINPKNLRKYVEAYMNRKDISDKLQAIKTLDCLLIAGSKSPYLQGVVQLYGRMDKSKTSLLKIDNVVDVINEAPEKLAHSMLLFVKGLGYLTSLQLPGVERQRTYSSGSQGSGQGGDSEASGSGASKAALGAIGRRRTLSMEDYDLPRPRRLSLSAQQPSPPATNQ